ncbi:MAG: hypothetical protein SF097_06425 [Acidobacteriota bacterium]|nr:hypothetical protein [Acidobacteriota bacterium]
MNKLFARITFCGFLLTAVSVAVVAQTHADFSGSWVLDVKKTRDVPADLKSYYLSVKQDEKQISVESKIEGSLTPATVQDQNRPSQTAAQNAINTAVATGGSSTGTVGGGATDATSGGNKVVFAHGRALATVFRRFNCDLDGKVSVRETVGLTPGKLKRRATWKKGDKTLEIHLERDFEVQGNQFTSYVKEIWELAEGGKVLKIKRTVNLLAGWDEATLVFNRESAKP